MALRDSMTALLAINRRDPDDIALAQFIKSKLEEFDAAKAAVDENQRVDALMTQQPKED